MDAADAQLHFYDLKIPKNFLVGGDL